MQVEQPLSPRESEVARLVAEGKTNKEIAVDMAIKPRLSAGRSRSVLMAAIGLEHDAGISEWADALPYSELVSPCRDAAVRRPSQQPNSTLDRLLRCLWRTAKRRNPPVVLDDDRRRCQSE